MSRSYNNYTSPRNSRNMNKNNSWDNGRDNPRRRSNESRSPNRDRSPCAGNSNSSKRYYTPGYRGFRGYPEQDAKIYWYDQPETQTPQVPATVNQPSLPEQHSKIEFEELNSKAEALETSNKSLREHMNFLMKDNSFLVKDSDSIANKLKVVKEDYLNATKMNEELNRKYIAVENSFDQLKNNNVDLFKKVEVSSRNAEQLEVQKKSYKADLDRITKQYQDVLKIQSEKIKEEQTMAQLIAENEQLKHKLKASEEGCKLTIASLKMAFAVEVNKHALVIKELENFKQDRTKLESLTSENELLKKRCKELEDENAVTTKQLEDENVMTTKELKIIKKKCANFKSKNNELTKELEQMKEKSSKGHQDKLKALNDQIKDLRQKCDKSDGEIFQLKGEIEKITKEKCKLRHKCREKEAQNTQLLEQTINLEMQNKAHENKYDQLKTDRDSTKEKNEKLQTEISKLKAFIPQLKGDLLKKIKEVEDEVKSGEFSDVEIESEPEKVEIHPNSGVYCNAEVWESINECKTANLFCKRLLVIMFNNEDLVTCSFKGMGSDTGARRPALDPKKVEALTACVLNKFPSYTSNEVTQTCNTKLFDLRQKQKSKKKSL